jgi:hypothetical protein
MKKKTPKWAGKSTNHYRDYDYKRTLDPEAKAWLETFDSEYYGGNVSVEGEHLHTDLEQKREIWRSQKRRKNDILNISNVMLPTDVSPELNPEQYLLLTTLDEEDLASDNPRRRKLARKQIKERAK